MFALIAYCILFVTSSNEKVYHMLLAAFIFHLYTVMSCVLDSEINCSHVWSILFFMLSQFAMMLSNVEMSSFASCCLIFSSCSDIR